MKHEDATMTLADLFNRVFRDSDTPWREVIGLPDDELDSDGSRLLAERGAELWRVTWPEHVLTPRFNSDATYRPA